MGFVNVGPLELLVIGIIALLVLGPQRLPEAARSVGRGVREMKEALSGGDDDEPDAYYDEDREQDEEPDDEPARPAPAAPATAQQPPIDS